jgi:hypothetical protein
MHYRVAVAWCVLIPGFFDGDALEDARNDGGNSKERNQGEKRPAGHTIKLLRHDADKK